LISKLKVRTYNFKLVIIDCKTKGKNLLFMEENLAFEHANEQEWCEPSRESSFAFWQKKFTNVLQPAQGGDKTLQVVEVESEPSFSNTCQEKGAKRGRVSGRSLDINGHFHNYFWPQTGFWFCGVS
jgi:hypothetical protein